MIWKRETFLFRSILDKKKIRRKSLLCCVALILSSYNCHSNKYEILKI